MARRALGAAPSDPEHVVTVAFLEEAITDVEAGAGIDESDVVGYVNDTDSDLRGALDGLYIPKVDTPTDGNLAAVDEHGDITDSGVAASDLVSAEGLDGDVAGLIADTESSTRTALGTVLDGIDPLPEGGTTGQVLAKASNNDGDAEWIDIEIPESGIDGPDTSTANALARWDGTDGDALKDSAITVDDSGNTTLALNDNGTTPQLRVTQDGTGDAALRFAIGSTTSYALGIDNSETSDAFRITRATTGDATLDSTTVLLQGTSFLSAPSGLCTLATSTAGSNFYTQGGGGFSGTLSSSEYQLLSTNAIMRVIMGGSVSSTVSANVSYATLLLRQSPVTEAGSGTHPLMAQIAVKPLSITNGTAATTNAATIYVEGPATGTAAPENNYALWVDSGITRLDGNVEVGGTVDGRDLAADGSKLDTVESGAQVNVNADWDAESGDAQILNKPTLGTAAAADTTDFASAAQGQLADSAIQPGDLHAVATSGDYNDLENLPDIPDALADLDTGVTGSELDDIAEKLSGIEAGADVTDATNVAAAGAVMTSASSTSGWSFVVDEDNMASDSATKLPTQQSVKAYVDTGLSGKAASTHSHDASDITGLTASVSEINILDGATLSTAELNVLDGITASTTELNYVKGVTSSIQTQLSGKQDALGYTAENTSNKGVANGYASLDGGGKVPLTQLPAAIMVYKGMWDADENDPALTDGVGNVGDVYRVGVGGTQDLGSGEITFDVGDYVIYNGASWEKSDTTDAVSSVAGLVGDITASALIDALTDGSVNKVFTAADRSKLDGIEAGADVTDATNVDAAGAVMNSDTSTASMSFVVDEDNMASDSATKVPTQQSVKAYVDSGISGKADAVHTHTGSDIVDLADALEAELAGVVHGLTEKPSPLHTSDELMLLDSTDDFALKQLTISTLLTVFTNFVASTALTMSNKTLTNPTITGYTETTHNLGTVTTAVTIDLANGTVQRMTLTASTMCTVTMPSAAAGKSFTVMVFQDASTGLGSAFFSGVKWPVTGTPITTPTAGTMDMYTFVSDGTNWYGSVAQGYTP